MKISYKYISEIFQNALNQNSVKIEDKNKIGQLLFCCFEINKTLWNLEDISRMHHLGFESIAKAKMEIDLYNQKRNDTINQIDLFLDEHLGNVTLQSLDKFYSESPGMIIDRMVIIFIRHHSIKQLIDLIKDKELKEEYIVKKNQLAQNLNELGIFLDSYFGKISNREAFFNIYKPLKIYNDDRIKIYIKILTNGQN